MRRKNPHPQRAVNARTVLKVSRDKEEEVEEEEPVLCLRIPDEDDDLEANHHQNTKRRRRRGRTRRRRAIAEDSHVRAVRRYLGAKSDAERR